MTDDRRWWTVILTDGTETHPHASHIGFNPLGPDGPEVVFYADRGVNIAFPDYWKERNEANE